MKLSPNGLIIVCLLAAKSGGDYQPLDSYYNSQMLTLAFFLCLVCATSVWMRMTKMMCTYHAQTAAVLSDMWVAPRR